MTKQQDTDALVASLEKQYGAGTIMRLDGKPTITDVIPTGALSLDVALGVGGYPRGRVIEIFGPEASGKTTLTLHAIAECQRDGGLTAFVDAEHALDLQYAKALGVVPDRVLLSQPDCGEQALSIVESLVDSAKVDLVVVDSVAALTPKAEIDGEMGDPTMGAHARLMSQALRKLVAKMAKTRTTVLFVNQTRMKIGVLFGSPVTTTGGNALKFYASVRLDVSRRQQIKHGEHAVGNDVVVKVVKNKLAPPFQEAELQIIWGKGLDAVGDLLNVGVKVGVVQKSGAWLSWDGDRLGQGFNNAAKTLQDNPGLRQAIDSAVRATLAKGT